MDEARANALIAPSTPVYHITGALHSTETGSPTALMELGYRLAVDEAPYMRAIRAGVITLITPVVEVDGRDRKVDVYNWHLANPGKRSEEHTSELQSLMRISYAVFCLKNKQTQEQKKR